MREMLRSFSEDLARVRPPTRRCSCGQPVWIQKRGLCRTCYSRWYRATNPDRYRKYKEQRRSDRSRWELRTCCDCAEQFWAYRGGQPGGRGHVMRCVACRRRHTLLRKRSHRHDRRALQLVGDLTPLDERLIVEAGIGRPCPSCRQRMTLERGPHQCQLDHEIGVAIGGAHHTLNCRALCATCNNTRPQYGQDIQQLNLTAVVGGPENPKRRGSDTRGYLRVERDDFPSRISG